MRQISTESLAGLVNGALTGFSDTLYMQECESEDACIHVRYIEVERLDSQPLPHKAQYNIVKGCSCSGVEPREIHVTGEDELITRLKYYTHTWRDIMVHDGVTQYD